jgi:hypothetical protein
VLAKINSTNFNTQWVDQTGGNGGVTPPVSFTGTDPATVVFTVTGAAAQSSGYMNVYANGGATPLFNISSSGEVRGGPGSHNINGTLKIGNTDGTRKGIVFNAVTGQSAKLLDMQVNTVSMMSVNADGSVVAPNIGNKVIVLNAIDDIPQGTPIGTVILRRP